MSEEYTLYIQKNMLSFMDELDEDQEYKKFIEFLNSDDFRSFGDGIAYLIKKKDQNADITAKNFLKYLKSKCLSKGVEVSAIGTINTFKDWFAGRRPDKKSESREKMFALSFALGLSVEEVNYLFHKVYLDRAFDYRNYKETVYYYCIANGRSYKKARDIITTIENNNNKKESIEKHTESISKKIETIKNDEDLISWVCTNWNSFQFNNDNAKKYFKTLLENAKAEAKKEYEAYKETFESPGSLREKSNSFVYKIIFNCFSDQEDGKKFNSVFEKSTNVRKEIKANFPDIDALCRIERNINSPTFNINYDELRKYIILLVFYIYARKIQNDLSQDNIYDEEKTEKTSERFISSVNDYLHECGMCELYAANPYDLLFLASIRTENPIDTFRDIIADIKYSFTE